MVPDNPFKKSVDGKRSIRSESECGFFFRAGFFLHKKKGAGDGLRTHDFHVSQVET